jgi:hypothetical protein
MKNTALQKAGVRLGWAAGQFFEFKNNNTKNSDALHKNAFRPQPVVTSQILRGRLSV